MKIRIGHFTEWHRRCGTKTKIHLLNDIDRPVCGAKGGHIELGTPGDLKYDVCKNCQKKSRMPLVG